MKTIKVSEATPIQLDWLVAKCEDHEVESLRGGAVWYWLKCSLTGALEVVELFKPSTDWAQGGPIIEAEGIELLCNLTATEAARFTCGVHADWQAFDRNSRRTEQRSFASTPLIAAMRCYVASKLGDVVEVPDEMVQ